MRRLWILLALGLCGCGDYDDAKEEEALYCDMVAKGYWPDYRGVYQERCLRRSLELLESPETPEPKHPGQKNHKRLIVDRR